MCHVQYFQHLCECFALIRDEVTDLLRELQQRDCKDDGDNARSIYLDRHGCASAACLFSANHFCGVSYRQSSFAAVYTYDESQNYDQDDYDRCNLCCTDCTAAYDCVVQHCCTLRHVGNDIDKDDHGRTITNTFCCDLFSQPHYECGTAYQTKYGCDIYQRAVNQIHVLICVNQTGTLDQRQDYC